MTLNRTRNKLPQPKGRTHLGHFARVLLPEERVHHVVLDADRQQVELQRPRWQRRQHVALYIQLLQFPGQQTNTRYTGGWVGWVDEWMGGWMGGWMDKWMDAWLDGWVNGCGFTGGWMNRWAGGWVGG